MSKKNQGKTQAQYSKYSLQVKRDYCHIIFPNQSIEIIIFVRSVKAEVFYLLLYYIFTFLG